MPFIAFNRSRRLLLCGALCALAAAPVAAQKVYQWTDASGRTVFSDQPPPVQHIPVKEKDVTPPPVEQTPSYSMRRTAEAFPVVLYVADNCGDPCAGARTLLDERKIPFTERSVRTAEDIQAFKDAFGDDTPLPSASVGMQKLRGFAAERWNVVLDDVGYPRQ